MTTTSAFLALDDPTVGLAFQAAGIGVWAWDTATDQIRVTSRVNEMLHFAPGAFPSELLGFAALVHPDDQPMLADVIARHRADAAPLLLECLCRLGDGTGWRRLRIRGSRDQTTGITIGISEDISDLDAQTLALRQSERRLREAQRLARVGSWEFDLRTQQITWSDETYQLFGFDPAEGPPSYEAYLSCLSAEEQARLATATQAALSAGTPYEMDQQFTRRDGEQRWLHAIGDPIRGADGRITGLAGTVADITERKRTEAQLVVLKNEAELATKAKSAFLANVSHELRTPMNGILGMLSLLLETQLQPAQKQYAWTAYSAAESLLGLLNDLLDFSKIEAGKLELQTIAFAPRDTLQTTVQLWQGRAQEKGIALAAAVDPAVPEILRSDSLRLRQIILNLISNAVKFTSKGHVIVRLEVAAEDAESVTLRASVTDSGSGISAADQARLFQPFTQLTQQDGGMPGTGLGLSICKRLAGLLGGEIGVESEPGRGSVFWFTARCFRAPTAGMPTQRFAPTSDGVQIAAGKRLLVVEDHPVNRLVALRLLERTGAVIDVATTGAEALAAVSRQAYDLVLMDCQMPEMNGFDASEAIRRLEAERGSPRVPIVAMTANAMTEDRARCLAAGMDDHVAKPIDRMLLFEAVYKWTSGEAPQPGSGLSTAAAASAPGAPPSLPPVEEPGSAEFITTAKRFVHDLANAVQAEDPVRLEETADWLRKLSASAGHTVLTALIDPILATPAPRERDWYALIGVVRKIQMEMERIRTGH